MADLGYDADFLGTALAPPVARDGDADTDPVRTPLDYEHFTVRMHPTRRLAWWVAWNIDGMRLFPSESISRSAENFRLDPRIPAATQTGSAAYSENDLDRGHLARRSDLLWGTLSEARQASSDSFFFTNITPQMADFNQSGRGIVQLPVEHWKVVVYRLDGQLRFKSFVLTQDLDGLERAVPDFLDDFDTYLVPLGLLEERTGLTFESMRGHAPPTDLQQWDPVLVEDAEQVTW